MTDLETRRVRAAQNQALFREVNERIGALAGRWVAAEAPLYVCECLDPECAQTIRIAQDDYERVRQSPTRFFVIPGHEDRAVETVVEKTDHYYVVRKIGEAGETAAALDRRAGANAN
jgi:hypothetical protein